MFRLLIVDDEKFSLEGILKRISWRELGVTSVATAIDGLYAISAAKSFAPDIVLTDIKMPRMNGIDMSFELRKIYPDCKIIFMSGYSDKEYLKSAIELKAVSYVEKPIVIDQIIKAIENAVAELNVEKNRRMLEDELTQKLEVSTHFVRNELTLSLVNRDYDLKYIKDQLSLAGLDPNLDGDFTCILLKVFPKIQISPPDFQIFKQRVNDSLAGILRGYGLNGIFGFKSNDCILIHLYGRKDNKLLDKNKLLLFSRQICESFFTEERYFVSIGKHVTGIVNLPDSYESAVVGLQKAFFQDYNSIISECYTDKQVFTFDENQIKEFVSFLTDEKHDQAMYLVSKLSSDIRSNGNAPVNSVKDIFYRILLQVIKCAEEHGIEILENDYLKFSLWDKFSEFNTLNDMDRFVKEKINDYFTIIKERRGVGSSVSTILKYIHAFYSDENLSIKGISEHTYLTESYICLIFREATGKTINQYITEYRIGKSKELLKDKRYKLNDIANHVGYSNGSYFTKIFKKTTGLTPSEYRERYLI